MAGRLDLTNPATLRAVARRAGLGAHGHLSQNFLVDRTVLERIVEVLAPSSTDTVLEIGPGVGTLTGELLDHARRVVAVDLDPNCIRATTITQHQRPTLELIQADALTLDLAAIGLPERWLAAGNLPYHITTPLLSHLFEGTTVPERGVFLVQREVAARLAAEPGDWSLATIVVRSVADVERIGDVPPESFDPPPRVHSSIIRLLPNRRLEEVDREAVLDLARGAFQMRRKMIRHGLAHALDTVPAAVEGVLSATGIQSDRRPGTLSIDEWRELAAAVREMPGRP